MNAGGCLPVGGGGGILTIGGAVIYLPSVKDWLQAVVILLGFGLLVLAALVFMVATAWN
jgi:hypothetical protein